jgi:glutamyl-tRNA synthetase
VTFTDRLGGVRMVHLPSDSGDLVVRRKDGGFAYMLAVVVDDAAQGVTEVVRGDDLLDATAQQLAVYAALGHTTVPSWVHLPLVLGDDGRRLAKRNRSLQISALREMGVRPDTVRAWLAESLGLPATGEMAKLVQAFDWAQVPRQPVVFGAKQAHALAQTASHDVSTVAEAAGRRSPAGPR